ncbi:MAG TPA: class I SAM-dependent methyltransferase [Terriglobia bacterium]|nr:class I SAM-dependent methyltransferase [Terriglobia bacterium]
MKNELGIWKALPLGREDHFSQFIEEYQTVRRSEGRGSPGGLYYLALPHKDITGRNSWQWKIRAKSFRYLLRKVLPQIADERGGGLDILDVGAGNCWLSYRLALCGHWPVAIDLRTDELDGLGAARHYLRFLSRSFPRFFAEMDRLPFAKAQFDLVIFNASFHYSGDYEATLEEALRCLRRPGHILLIDSPFYSSEESGRKMVAERRQAYREKYGFPSQSVSSGDFLTGRDLEQLTSRYGIQWQLQRPWYGLRWALRPARAWLRRRREPAKFYLFWGTV